MSQEKNRSFIDEIQEKYKVTGVRYTPLYYAEAGTIITLEKLEKRGRPECPICSGYPIVHGYIKNGKIRNNERGFDTI